MTCENPYCAKSHLGRGNYEHAAGILCDRCEDHADAHENDMAVCANCGEYKMGHDEGLTDCKDFEVEDVDRTCCDTLAGEPHRFDCAKAARN